MPLDQELLKGTQSREWVVAKPPSGASPQWVYTGRDESGLGPIYVALAAISAPPSRETMRALHAAYKGKSNIQLVVGAVLGNQVWIFGPDEKTEVTEPLALDQGCRQLQSALDEPDAIAAYTRLGQFRRSLDTTSLVGVTNSGLFASYHIRENVPKRNDWKGSCEKAKPLLALRNEHLIKALGFKSEKTAGNALLLTTGTPQSKAVAILLDETEQFDATSARHTGISPVAFGLNVAARQGVPWLFVLRKDQIRIYPAKDGVGVGQKGQVETYLEIDLAAIDSERAGLLTLIFSADALEPNGTANDLLQGSQLFASQLGSRLRERIYEHVVPQLSKSVAEHLREQGTKLDSEGLSLAYRLTLRILFRLLFQAYAEDRGLLPAGRNEGYDANSLKTIAKRIINTHQEQFGKSKTLWFDLVQVWDAIDEGNETWNVPAYNGGLFGKDPNVYPEGSLIEKLGIQDDVLGVVLQHLLLDISEDGVVGPVDFRSLSVREFGTIYEGLLESSLSVASESLNVDSKGTWVPASKGEAILVQTGEVYFHSASGERKSSGSYFTPSVVVDHLISNSLDPALDQHLLRIKSHLENGDQASAARDFFDFRVADLAMGSGHFLVAAVDRIEARMRTFLAEKETQVPGVNAELSRLALAAKSALGNDESAIGEIEPAALLRRQIARRCIYGLDINPLAVELSRLAIWIHTFVPGLPMSSLDHGLVCANSLTGIGTIQEAIQALLPDDGGQISFYEGVIQDNLEVAGKLLIEVANSDEAKKSEVKAAAKVAQQARLAARPTLAIFNAAVAARLGIFNPRDIYDQESLEAIAASNEVTQAIREISPAHMPYLFPEVFLRENPGFDVLIGNPPWEKIKVEEHQWWAAQLPGLRGLGMAERSRTLSKFKESRPDLVQQYESAIDSTSMMRRIVGSGPYAGIGSGDIDLYKAFTWRNWQCLRENGWNGLVLPRGALTSPGTKAWRDEIMNKGVFKNVIIASNSKNWVFEAVHPQKEFAFVSIMKSTSESMMKFGGPCYSGAEFIQIQENLTSVTKEEFTSWKLGGSFPMLGNKQAGNIFRKMLLNPRFGNHPDFEFRGCTEFHETADAEILDSETDSKKPIEVASGRAFSIWNPDAGDLYAHTDESGQNRILEKISNSSTQSRSAYYGMNIDSIDKLPSTKARIAFRDVTNSTNSRTLVACLMPPNRMLVGGAPYLLRRRGTTRDEAFLLGIMSSLIFDWFARRVVEGHMKLYILDSMPVPRKEKNQRVSDLIVELTAQLAGKDDRYKVWLSEVRAKEAGLNKKIDFESLIAELDAAVAVLFDLERDEVEYIFSNFHRGWDFEDRLMLTLLKYDELSLNK
jgi:hypothetical protein